MFNSNGNKRDQMPTLPKVATVPLPLPKPKDEESPLEVVKYAPKRPEDHLDREAMSHASAAYDRLRIHLEQMREQHERQREEISSQRNRIDLLEHSLAEARNVANEYRIEADEAKAQTAAWKVFFTNVQAIFNQYEIPVDAPRKRDPNEIIAAAAQLSD